MSKEIVYMQIMFEDSEGNRYVGEVTGKTNRGVAVQLCEFTEIPTQENEKDGKID